MIAVGDSVIINRRHTVYNVVIAWLVRFAAESVLLVVNIVPVELDAWA